jgi:YD repeat-containing protein
LTPELNDPRALSQGSGGTGARVTTWNYHAQRGWLGSKVYDDWAAGPSYACTAACRLLTRTWARGITTTYGYTAAGDLVDTGCGSCTAVHPVRLGNETSFGLGSPGGQGADRSVVPGVAREPPNG